MSAPVNYLYTFDLGGRKGSDGDMSPSSVTPNTSIFRPDGQWCEYRLQDSPLDYIHVDGPITNGAVAAGLNGDGYGGWRIVSIALAVPGSLWDVAGGYDVALPDDAMGYVGVEFAPGSELASGLINVVSRRDFDSGRWIFKISLFSGTGNFGPGLSNDIFTSARFHLAVTGVNPPPPPEPNFWMSFIGSHEII